MTLDCPLPHEIETVQLAHGGGARATRRLLDEVVLPALGEALVPAGHDAAELAVERGRVAFTTDAYVVNPIEFPGGDIGSLSVFGTVNDLAMAGARPFALSLAFVLEEGLPIETLRRLCRSIGQAAVRAEVELVTGDLKVVERGRCDGLYVTTSGIGHVLPWADVHPRRVRPGDVVLCSGDLGRHGIALLAARQELRLELPLVSDCAPVVASALALLAAGVDVHLMRDPTRGGLSATLNELCLDTGNGIELDEAELPFHEAVVAACELYGLDPIDVASEGRFVAIVPEDHADAALSCLRAVSPELEPRWIGRVVEGSPARVVMRTRFGSRRIVEHKHGDLLPRIC